MTPDQVQQIVQRQIADLPDDGHLHGLVLSRCLITPHRVTAKSTRQPPEEMDVWVVLEETPDGDGYKIYYDPAEGLFGLAVNGQQGLLLLGLYGDFPNTVLSM